MRQGQKGFDISQFQDAGLDQLQAAKAAGYDFAIIRATHGTESVDTKWPQHYTNARAAGLKIGAYAFYYYATASKSDQETDNFLSQLRAQGGIDLPAFIDFENRGEYTKDDYLGSLSPEEITDRAIAAIDKIRAAGYTPGIYCDADWAKNKMNMARIPEDCIVWIADWGGEMDYKGRCEIRQTSSTGTIDGIGNGSVDLDEVLADFGAEAAPAPAPKAIAEDGDRGPKTITRWQQVMGTTVDGEISKPDSELIRHDQAFLNIRIPAALLQKYFGGQLKVDGDEGENTIAARQVYMFNAHKDVFEQVTGRALVDSDIDGELGHTTNTVHQVLLNRAAVGSGQY